jgi:tRNA dimethylallyltransferase
MKPKVVFLVGPTAVGKTQVAAALARRLKAQIISCDSMQIYKQMDILTSKPPVALRKRIKHCLIDVAEPTQEYDVSRYRREALKSIKDALSKGRLPLFVGGTGLYLSVVIDGIFRAKVKDKNIRRRLYQEAEARGSVYLYQRLRKIDPQAALKIHHHDTRRLVRALEVFESTGKPISLLQKQRSGITDKYAVRIFCLNLAREKLYQRIDARVEKMFRQGLVAEVKKLLKLKLSRTAACALGLKELRGYFEGKYDLAQAKSFLKRNSRRYAKRQLTWFRKDKRIEWVNISDKQSPQDIATIIAKKIKD